MIVATSGVDGYWGRGDLPQGALTQSYPFHGAYPPQVRAQLSFR